MSHAQCSLVDRITGPMRHSTPSLLNPSNRSIPCIPQRRVPFGRMAEQSPLKGYEPNGPVEVGGTEVTTKRKHMHLLRFEVRLGGRVNIDRVGLWELHWRLVKSFHGMWPGRWRCFGQV